MTEEPRFEISRRWVACVDLLITDGWAATYRQFCETIGIKPQSLNDVKSERRSVTLDMIYDTCKTYPVYLDYLMWGTGPMSRTRNVEGNVEAIVEETRKSKINHVQSPLQSAAQQTHQHTNTEFIVATQDTSGNPTYTVVNHKAAANYLNGYQSQEYYEQLGVVTLPRALVGSDRQGIFLQIEGDSMTPKFHDRDWVACTLLDRSEWAQVRDNECYVVVSTTYGIQFKRIRNRLTNGFIRCQSDNRRHRSYDIEEEDLLQLFSFRLHVSPDDTNSEESLYQKVDHLEDTTTDLLSMYERLQQEMNERFGEILKLPHHGTSHIENLTEKPVK